MTKNTAKPKSGKLLFGQISATITFNICRIDQYSVIF